jgi:acetyl-CoA carboxylase biotin carboxyl carrier protein
MTFEGVTLAIDGKRIGTSVLAPGPGRFLRAHPMRLGTFALPGQVLAAGATLGLIEMGPILVPVRAPLACIVLSVAPVGVVGYGTALAEIAAFEDLRTGGIST